MLHAAHCAVYSFAHFRRPQMRTKQRLEIIHSLP